VITHLVFYTCTIVEPLNFTDRDFLLVNWRIGLRLKGLTFTCGVRVSRKISVIQSRVTTRTRKETTILQGYLSHRNEIFYNSIRKLRMFSLARMFVFRLFLECFTKDPGNQNRSRRESESWLRGSETRVKLFNLNLNCWDINIVVTR